MKKAKNGKMKDKENKEKNKGKTGIKTMIQEKKEKLIKEEEFKKEFFFFICIRSLYLARLESSIGGSGEEYGAFYF